jgi:hypothetical protein
MGSFANMNDRFDRVNMFSMNRFSESESDVVADIAEYGRTIPPEVKEKERTAAEYELRGDMMAAGFIGAIPEVLRPFNTQEVSVSGVAADIQKLPIYGSSGGFQERYKSKLIDDYKRQQAVKNVAIKKEEERFDNITKETLKAETARAKGEADRAAFIKDASETARQRYNIPKKRRNPYHFNVEIGY